MSSYELNELMWDIHHNEETLNLFKENPEAVMGQYNLSTEEKSALSNLNQIDILKVGGHSLLTLFFVRKNGVLNHFDHAVDHNVDKVTLKYG